QSPGMSLKFRSGGADARAYRMKALVGRLCDLLQAHPFQLDEQERHTMLLAHVHEDLASGFCGFAAAREHLGTEKVAIHFVGIENFSLAPRMYGLSLNAPPLIAHHVGDNLVDPGLELGALLELGQFAVHDDEHLLADVVEMLGGHS